MICIADAARTLELEKKAVATQKISIRQLMDAAGKALADEVTSIAGTVLEREPSPKKLYPLIVVVCGKGNNAGDGFVAARYLNKNQLKVKVVMLYESSQLSADAKNAYDKLPKNLIVSWEKRSNLIEKAQIIIDAIFGFSFRPPLRSLEKQVIADINKESAYIISADIPSGLQASTGQAAEEAIKANMTVSFSCIKKGLVNAQGPNYAGLIKAVDIGIDNDLINNFAEYQCLDIHDASKLLPEKKALDHKKTIGKVLVVAGSSAFTGAAVLTAEAALRSGSGFVILAVPEAIKSIIQEKISPEVIVKGLDCTSDGTLAFAAKKEIITLSQNFDCLAIGPGLTIQEKTSQLIASLMKEVAIPMVIDADALNAIAESRESGPSLMSSRAIARDLQKIKTQVILTPHAGELSRLTGLSVAEIEKDRFNAARLLAKGNVTVLLKGRYSIIASKNKTFVNLTSNAGMATAGTGDVLTGITASLFAHRLESVKAASLGAYVHGLAGDIAVRELSEHALIASDIIDCLPYAFKTIYSHD